MKHLIFAAILLLAVPAWAEPLETSFCKEIPDGINFGDSYDSIVEKMGRPPDNRREIPDGRFAIHYYEEPFLELMFGHIGYIFTDNRLTLVTFGAGGVDETEEEARALKLAIPKHLALFTRLYGEPSTFMQESAAPHDPPSFVVKKWEFKNNAILAIPPIIPKEHVYFFLVFVCPLEPSGHYDIVNF